MIRVVLTGGGTGGHVFPLIAVAENLKKTEEGNMDILYIGSGAPLEREAMEKKNIQSKFIASGKMRRYFSWRNFIDPFKVFFGFLQSLCILLRYMPDAVFSKGGYVGVPVIIAAWLYRIPVIIHESDAVPGTANKIMGKLADKVVISYQNAATYFENARTAFFGNPVREDISRGDTRRGRAKIDFSESKPVIFILGGSQGSQVINEAVARILPQLLFKAQVIHQTGENNYEDAIKAAGEQGIKAGHEGYYPVKFINAETMADFYALADLVISRAGANSVAEIAANKKPSILIPLENSANNHQRMNAYEVSRTGGSLVLEESNLGEHIFLQKIEKILGDENLRREMAEKIYAFYHPLAAEHLARAITALARGKLD